MEDSGAVQAGREIVGNYVIERELGRGGMGVVYAAKHRVLGRPAAIKVLLANTIEHRDRVERFFNEARAAMAIDHPGVVKVYDVGIAADDRAYIAMELLDGGSLASRLARGPLPLRQAVAFGRQIADALAAAHEAGVIHRDLKPENIIDTGERLVIVDFGIAKLQGPVGVRTATGALIGTPLYMSPEQCEGLRELDARSDLYALGCVLFAMLTGQPPFTGGGTGGLIGQHLHVPPPPLRTRCPVASEALEHLVSVLLAKSPEGRFRTARATAAALASPEVSVLRATDVAATADLPAASAANPSVGTVASQLSHPHAAAASGAGQTVDTVSSRIHHPQFAATHASPPATATRGAVVPSQPRRRRGLALVVAACVATAAVTLLLARACTRGSEAPVRPAGTGSGAADHDAAIVAMASPDASEPDVRPDVRIEVGGGSGSAPATEQPRGRTRRGAGAGSARPKASEPAAAPPPDARTPEPPPEPERPTAPEPEPPKPVPPRVHETVRFAHGDFSAASVPPQVIERVAAAYAADPSRKVILRGQAERDEPGVAERLAFARANAVLIQLTSHRVPRSAIEIRAITIPAPATADGTNRRVDIDLAP